MRGFLPAVISILGSYMICREEQDDILKSLLLIPVSETKMTAAKMIVSFFLSVLIYLLLFCISFATEAVLHFSDLSIEMVLGFLKAFYPITVLMGVAGYYETSIRSKIVSMIVLLLCGILAFFLLMGHSQQKKGRENYVK